MRNGFYMNDGQMNPIIGYMTKCSPFFFQCNFESEIYILNKFYIQDTIC